VHINHYKSDLQTKAILFWFGTIETLKTAWGGAGPEKTNRRQKQC
jgi:hypothetical protein